MYEEARSQEWRAMGFSLILRLQACETLAQYDAIMNDGLATRHGCFDWTK